MTELCTDPVTADCIASLISGDLTPRARVLAALLPALVASAYFFVGFAVFSAIAVFRGMPRDPDVAPSGTSLLTGSYLHRFFIWAVTPLWRLVLASGIPAIALTTLAALLGLGAALAVAAGRFALGGWLFLFSGILDATDGRLARARRQVTPVGAAIDSVLDRYTDTVMLLGLAWYYRASWVLAPVLLAILGTSLVPYVRAKSEALGFQVRSGLMQRCERILTLGAAVALSPILEALAFPSDSHPRHWLAVAGVVFLAATSNATAVSRFLRLLRSLGGIPKRVLLPIRSETVAAGLATAVDYAVVCMVMDAGGVPLAGATALGCVVGAAVNFSLNRAWTLHSREARLPQLGRYALVSVTSMLLNAGAVGLLSLHSHLHHAFIWWPARAAVYVFWNLPLQRDYVFAAAPPPTPVARRRLTSRAARRLPNTPTMSGAGGDARPVPIEQELE